MRKTCCYDYGYEVGDTFKVIAYDNGAETNDVVELIDDDGTERPEFIRRRDNFSTYIYLDNVEKIVEEEPKSNGTAHITMFNTARDRDSYIEILKNYGYCESSMQSHKGMWLAVFNVFGSPDCYASFKTRYDAEHMAKYYNFNIINGHVDLPQPEKDLPPVAESINENKQPEKKESVMGKVKTEKAKQAQIEAGKIALKIEIGKVANTQITKRVMKTLKFPPFLVGYKKQIEPLIRLLVANGGLVAAESMGVENKKAEYILEAMQLAGTQEVLGLINLDETIESLVGMIDPKLMARAGLDEETEEE